MCFFSNSTTLQTFNLMEVNVFFQGRDLKKSQHYPVAFGESVAELYLEHREMIRAEVDANMKNLLSKPKKELKDGLWRKTCRCFGLIHVLHSHTYIRTCIYT